MRELILPVYQRMELICVTFLGRKAEGREGMIRRTSRDICLRVMTERKNVSPRYKVHVYLPLTINLCWESRGWIHVVTYVFCCNMKKDSVISGVALVIFCGTSIGFVGFGGLNCLALLTTHLGTDSGCGDTKKALSREERGVRLWG